MVRRFVLVAAAVALLVRSGQSQSAHVNLSLRLSPAVDARGQRKPYVQLHDLLKDRRWADMIDAPLPVILSYHLEIWRSRDGWIDEFLKATEWQTIVTKEPLQDEYTVTSVEARPRASRFASRDSVARYLGLINQIDITPIRPGTFYYTLTLRITALSDTDIDELERFLSGDPEPREQSQGKSVTRGIRRFLLRMAGLPSEELQAKSEEFIVLPP
ncbi:MAG: DUF4390 domain-containing protein [Gemmatimonadota bacterium]